MKTIIAVILLLIMWATIPQSQAITVEQFQANKVLKICYVQRDSLGEIKQVLWARYGKPARSPVGTLSREVRGDVQWVDDSSITFPFFGAASLYQDTAAGTPEIRMYLQQYGGDGTNMVYFHEQTGRPDAWEQVGCPPSPASSSKRAASAMSAPAVPFETVK